MQAKSKKILFRIIAIVVAAAIVGLIVFFVIRAIRNIDDMLTMEELRYDEYSTDYDPDVDSWLQIDPHNVGFLSAFRPDLPAHGRPREV